MKGLRFSLRWQVILLATTVLVTMAGLFAWQQHTRLVEGFQGQRTAAHRNHADLLGQLLTEDANRLQSLAGMLMGLPGLREGLVQADAARIEASFAPLWPEMNLSYGVEGAVFYDARHRLLANWGLESTRPSERLAELARAAARGETAAWRLSCTDQCVHFVAVPVVQRGTYAGALVLGSGLQDLILTFRRLTRAELAVLSSGAGAFPYLAPFRSRLVAVSGDPANAELLQALRESDRVGDEFVSTRAGRHYRVYGLATPIPAAEATFLVIEDVTGAVEGMGAAIRDNLVWGAGVLGLATLALYTLLIPPMRRFRRIAAALPLLGQGRYEAVHETLADGTGLLWDELVELSQVAIQLAVTLERLDSLNQRHMEQLRAQAQELERERDFIANLLDTAPVLIVTHGADGRIRSANAHAVAVSGYEISQLRQLTFLDTFFSVDQHAVLQTLLEDLRPGEVRHSEGHFQRPDGGEREVVWFHSLFSSDIDARLSVGLDVTAHKQIERRLAMLIDHDAVTGLLSRSAFQRELDRLLQSPQGKGVLVVCDIDEFKAVNEASGHEQGDAMLALYARKATTQAPLPTLAGRLGGDEFAFYHTGLSLAEAIVVARSLNQSLVGIGPGLGLPKHSFTSCVGIAFSPEHGRHADALIANGETALAQARAKGEGNWHLYSPQDAYQVEKGRRMYWSDELERALAENRLTLHFQPILHLGTRLVSHWEALLRLKASDGSLIPPGQFIGVAEATGLVRRLDRWVINEAVRTLRHALHEPGLRLAVNLSGRSLDDGTASGESDPAWGGRRPAHPGDHRDGGVGRHQIGRAAHGPLP